MGKNMKSLAVLIMSIMMLHGCVSEENIKKSSKADNDVVEETSSISVVVTQEMIDRYYKERAKYSK